MDEFRLITLDPGHFHAALIQKEMYAGVSPRVAVYAPLASDLTEHLNRVVRFNQRKENPTRWELDIHAAPDFLERMLAERPGNIVVLSGRNRAKIDYIRAAARSRVSTCWRTSPGSSARPIFRRSKRRWRSPSARGLVAYDIMTERYEITSILQRELVNDRGDLRRDSARLREEPAVYMESVHHILKLVAGVPNLRPAVVLRHSTNRARRWPTWARTWSTWSQWTLFPETAIDYRSDIRMLAASRWPTAITAAQFRQVTGERGRRPRLLLQYARLLRAARRPREARRALAMGGAGRDRRYASRRVSRLEIAGRGPAGQGGELPAGVVRGSRRRRREAGARR